MYCLDAIDLCPRGCRCLPVSLQVCMYDWLNTAITHVCADDDDEWTEVSTSQLLQQADTTSPAADSNQQSRDTVEPSDDTQAHPVSLNPAAVSSYCDSHQADGDMSSVAAAAVESQGSDVTQSSMDHDLLPSSHTKNDGLVVVSVTPERTSPSDDSSNAKGLLLSSQFTCTHILYPVISAFHY